MNVPWVLSSPPFLTNSTFMCAHDVTGTLMADDHPAYIADALKLFHIQTLYPPQEEALPAVLTDRNVVLSIPTAAGKSLIAYLAILHQLKTKGGKALYIVPLRALAREKYEELSQFSTFGLKVGISTGDLDESDSRLSRYDIIICTSEKADSLLRHGITWIDDIHVLVIDEIHLIHDAHRGPTLEVIIARFKAQSYSATDCAVGHDKKCRGAG